MAVSGRAAEGVSVHDRASGATSRVPLGREGNASSGAASISADGSVVAFSSDASNLVVRDTNGAADVFIQQRP